MVEELSTLSNLYKGGISEEFLNSKDINKFICQQSNKETMESIQQAPAEVISISMYTLKPKNHCG